jgi:hypothetical protein
MQFKQEAKRVRDYGAFRDAIECQLQRYVVPRLAKGRPNVVVFPEDVGLMVGAAGSRGKAARAIIDRPGSLPECRTADLCATLKTLDTLRASYAKPLAFYEKRFGALNPLGSPFVAATDTIVRGWMGTFSDLAKAYGVYLVGSGPRTPFRETSKASVVKTLRDPDLKRVRTVYEATGKKIYNSAFIWAPKDVRRTGPHPLRNVVRENRKVPLTGLELAMGFTAGPATGAAARRNLEPYRLPGTKARLGIATSLPAFVFGTLPTGVDPCSDTSKYYMRCLEKLGTNVVVQDEANPGPWATPPNGEWQPLDWMGSSWLDVAEATTPGLLYNVTPFMTGNLSDIAFDGQSSVTQRGGAGAGPGCHYVGNTETGPNDPAEQAGYHGDKREFLALAPWVAPDGPRSALREVGRRLDPKSGDALENDYLETALVVDLPFPAVAERPNCATATPPPLR